MRWFGEDWGAPICRSAKQVPVPDVFCMGRCGRRIRDGENGLLLPYSGPVYRDGDEQEDGISNKYVVVIAGVPHVAYHLSCFFDEIGVRD